VFLQLDSERKIIRYSSENISIVDAHRVGRFFLMTNVEISNRNANIIKVYKSNL